MPRLARLDAPGVLHHVMGRGIERREIFQTDTDRQDFVDRLSKLAIKGAFDVYAWTLMPNHQRIDLEALTEKLCKFYQASIKELRSGSRRMPVINARRVISWIGVRELCYAGAEVARYLGVTNSCVTRIVSSDSKPEIGNLLDNLSTSNTNVP